MISVWNILNQKIQWITRDDNGETNGFTDKPEKTDGRWHLDDFTASNSETAAIIDLDFLSDMVILPISSFAKRPPFLFACADCNHYSDHPSLKDECNNCYDGCQFSNVSE